ncbi:hypothetical protein [Fulvivirga lutea]|uniref:Uncharacterized protein n=1 Tax=Fulvivirga lutea TaxID=2810512 RepID=A0A974WE41_9BACT|nr:hypothetical protein [Fulvivirga lutea]QSE96599.1 hypothetical protein JR347_13470 [Fulvivirga lutea]
MQLTNTNRLLITALFFLVALAVILYEHFNGGVASHYFLHDKNMPKLSNWWSLLTLPLAAWTGLIFISKKTPVTKQVYIGFIGGLLFGLLITVLFYTIPDLTSYGLLLTFGIALFIPLYTVEYYLGFVLSMIVGFGGVLPVVIGLVLLVIYAIEYHFIRRLFLSLISKF